MHPMLQEEGMMTLKVIERSWTLLPWFQQARQWPLEAVECDFCLLQPGVPEGETVALVGPEGRTLSQRGLVSRLEV